MWECPCLEDAGVNPVTSYIPVFYLPVVGRGVNWHFYKAGLDDIRGMFAGSRAVLAPWLYPDGVAAGMLAAETGTPAWQMALGSDIFHLAPGRRRGLIIDACGTAAGVICVARRLADRLVACGVAGNRIHVVGNGVDQAMYRYRPDPETMSVPGACGLPDGRRIILFAGNLVEVKGADLLPALWREIKSLPGSSDFVLAVVGAGRLRKRIARGFELEGLSGSVFFTGSLSRTVLARLMNAASCLCVTSRSEGMPNIVVEAMASGLPVVVPDVGACGEMLEGEAMGAVIADWVPGGAGGLHDPGADRIREMAEAVHRLAGNGAGERMAFAGRSARRFGTWSDMARVILGLVMGEVKG